MRYVHLGQTGLVVSRLCLGTMNFGPQTSEADSFAIMDRALELGINYFDTANCYGGEFGEGVSEKIIGRWLAQGGGRRDQIVLATKVSISMGHGPNDRGLSAYHIRRACEDSLRRLQTDHVDVYIMHQIDLGEAKPPEVEQGWQPKRDLYRPPHLKRETPWVEIWEAMEQLKGAGKIIYVGSSNFAGWHIAQSKERAAARHFMGQVSEQSRYNLSSREVELEVIPVCRDYGIGLTPWSPLGGGLLGGALREFGEGRRASAWLRNRVEETRDQLEAYEALCAEMGERPSGVALAWLLHNPVVTAPVIGPRTVEQLEDSARAPGIELPEGVLARLDEIWPGPGGEAPDVYIW